MNKFRSTWHLVHLLMTFLTGGLWIIIWIFRTLCNSSANSKMMMRTQQEQLNRMNGKY